MDRRKFLASAAWMLSLLGIRKEAGKSEIGRFGSLVEEWRGMVATEWWYSYDLIETDRDGKVTTRTICRKLTA